jgi:hypothetical protein
LYTARAPNQPKSSVPHTSPSTAVVDKERSTFKTRVKADQVRSIAIIIESLRFTRQWEKENHHKKSASLVSPVFMRGDCV